MHAGDKKAYIIGDNTYYDRYQLGANIKLALGNKTMKFHLPVIFVTMIAGIAEKVSSFANKAAVLNIEKLNELKAVNWSCNNELAKAELGFSPAYNLQSGVAETINWYKAHKWL